MITLRPYQRDLLTRIETAMRSHRGILGVLPTGGGKTTIFCELARRYVADGKRVQILAHRRELVSQIAASLARVGVPHTIVAPAATISAAAQRQRAELGRTFCRRDAAPVVVGSVQTIARRGVQLAPPDLIIVDEGHHATGGTIWGRCITPWPAARLLLVTATPLRLDGRGLGVDAGGYAEHIVEGPSMAELIAGGFLADFVPYGCATPPVVRGIHRSRGDFSRGILADAMMSRPELVGDAVAHYSRLCPGESAVAFCVSVRHAAHVATAFRRRGIPSQSIDGTLGPAERQRRLAELESGAIRVLTSADLIGEGLDIPGITAAILLRPTQSLGLYLQQVGRALRPAPGKKRAVILDHAGNIGRHGMPDDPREWTLEGRRAGSGGPRDPGVVVCEGCFGIFRRAQVAKGCPRCGRELPPCPRVIAQRAGQLAELEREQRRVEMADQRKAQGRARDIESLARLPHVKSRGHAARILAAREQKNALVDRLLELSDAAGTPRFRSDLARMAPRALRAEIQRLEGGADVQAK